MTQNDCFHTIWSGGNDVHRGFDQLLETLNITAGVFGQVFQFFHTGSCFLPSRQGFIYRLHGFPPFCIARHTNRVTRFVPVLNADFYLIHSIQHIELSKADSADTADQHRVAQRDRVEPAGAAFAAGGGAEFVSLRAQVLANGAGQFSGKRA